MKRYNKEAFETLINAAAFDDDFNLYFMTDRSCGFSVQFSPICHDVDQSHKVLKRIMAMSWPDNTIVQILNIPSPHISSLLKNYAALNTKDDSLFDLRREALISKVIKNTELSGDNGPQVCDFQIIISVKLTVQNEFPTSGDITKTHRLMTSLVKILDDSDLSPKILKPDNLIQVKRFLLLQEELVSEEEKKSRYENNKMINEQILNNDFILDDTDQGLLLKGKNKGVELKMLSIKNFPIMSVFGSALKFMSDPFSSDGNLLNGFLFVNIFFPGATKKETVKIQETESDSWLDNNYADNSDQETQWLPELFEVKPEDETSVVSSPIESTEAKIYMGMGLYIDSSKSIFSAFDKTLKYYMSFGYQFLVDDSLALPLLMSALPLNNDKDFCRNSNRYKTQSKTDITKHLPVLGQIKGTATPTLMFVGHDKQIILMDIFDVINGNVKINTGNRSDRNYIAEDIISSYMSAGSTIHLIDKNIAQHPLNGGASIYAYDPDYQKENNRPDDIIAKVILSYLKKQSDCLDEEKMTEFKKHIATAISLRAPRSSIMSIVNEISGPESRLQQMGYDLRQQITNDSEESGFMSREKPEIKQCKKTARLMLVEATTDEELSPFASFTMSFISEVLFGHIEPGRIIMFSEDAINEIISNNEMVFLELILILCKQAKMRVVISHNGKYQNQLEDLDGFFGVKFFAPSTNINSHDKNLRSDADAIVLSLDPSVKQYLMVIGNYYCKLRLLSDPIGQTIFDKSLAIIQKKDALMAQGFDYKSATMQIVNESHSNEDFKEGAIGLNFSYPI